MKRLRDLYEKALSEWGADHPGEGVRVCVCEGCEGVCV